MKRKEAIKELRGFIRQLTEGCQEAIKVLVPELKESEGERIREVLVDMVKRETGFTGFPSQGQVLAYLEKQKEQKPAEWSEEDKGLIEKELKEQFTDLAETWQTPKGECYYDVSWNDLLKIANHFYNLGKGGKYEQSSPKQANKRR